MKIKQELKEEKQKNCSHAYSSSKYVIDKDYNHYTGDEIDNSHWEYEEVGTYVDINIHQYKCTQCDKVFNYN